MKADQDQGVAARLTPPLSLISRGIPIINTRAHGMEECVMQRCGLKVCLLRRLQRFTMVECLIGTSHGLNKNLNQTNHNTNKHNSTIVTAANTFAQGFFFSTSFVSN